MSDSPPVALLHRDLSTCNQISALLSITSGMAGLLINPARDAESIPGANAVPGEAKIAAETTFIRACEQLDQILADKSRWGTDYQRSVEKLVQDNHQSALALMKAQTEALEAQKRAAEDMRTPHALYSPILYPVGGGWMALVGDPTDLDSGISGVGASPEAALRDFDETFLGTHPRVRQTLIDKHNEKQNMDSSRTPDGGPTAQGGEDVAGDRPELGA